MNLRLMSILLIGCGSKDPSDCLEGFERNELEQCVPASGDDSGDGGPDDDYEGDSAGECSDGEDNDGDGLVDCEDSG